MNGESLARSLGTALGAGVGMVFALAAILVAATAGFERPEVASGTTALVITLVGYGFIGVTGFLAAAAYISPFFPGFGFGFCYLATPAALISVLICAFTGHYGAALGLGVWVLELVTCYLILMAIVPLMSGRGAFVRRHQPA